jgi:murein DD-endopeptidase MepM/ murein hydrolase activator NlpD
LLDLIHQIRHHAAHFRSRHARLSALAVMLLLGGFGALAIAVAPLSPDAAPPQQFVTEAVAVAPVGEQLEALATLDLELTRSDLTRPGDSIDSVLSRLGVADAEVASALRRDRAVRRAIDGHAQRLVHARARTDGSLIELVVRYPAHAAALSRTHFSRLAVSRVDGRWTSRVESRRFTSEPRLGNGTILSTLAAAAAEAQLPAPVASQLKGIFASELRRGPVKGATFQVVYEALSADGEPVAWNQGAGRVLAAELTSDGRTHQAIWFDGAGRGGAYLDAQGRSRSREATTMMSPVEASRVTSGFANRMHPILRGLRAHRGVDYAAPTGTPVHSVADGVVEFAGRQTGYGNVVYIDHGNERSTVYAHLSRIDVTAGQRVERGRLLGAVGATGWATGPHLHFELRIAGEYQDPAGLNLAVERAVLDASGRKQFSALADALQTKLDLAESMSGQRSRFE